MNTHARVGGDYIADYKVIDTARIGSKDSNIIVEVSSQVFSNKKGSTPKLVMALIRKNGKQESYYKALALSPDIMTRSCKALLKLKTPEVVKEETPTMTPEVYAKFKAWLKAQQ